MLKQKNHLTNVLAATLAIIVLVLVGLAVWTFLR